ncbi:accessory gene regulator ArgB-like protein [Desulfolucanica intricata]|uniref:accessory gene regulator ArgB-like protein n=1 Tax=Desulfolucanica intricata TaxID=1285191 RepID=UPI000833FF98|nr:accessory gene regulator B family protein [Desulfolucanica intricata]
MDSFFQKLALKISSETGQNVDTMLFGLRTLWNFLAGYSVLGILSLLFGIFPYAVIAALSASTLRVMTGGAHASSSNRCLVYGTLVFLTLGFLAQQLKTLDLWLFLNVFTILIWVTGIPITIKYATSSINGKPLGTFTSGRRYRNLAIVFLSLWSVIVLLMSLEQTAGEYQLIFQYASLLGVTYQVFSLTPWGHKTVSIIDGVLQKIRI